MTLLLLASPPTSPHPLTHIAANSFPRAATVIIDLSLPRYHNVSMGSMLVIQILEFSVFYRNNYIIAVIVIPFY
jgi:hypothetical protein